MIFSPAGGHEDPTNDYMDIESDDEAERVEFYQFENRPDAINEYRSSILIRIFFHYDIHFAPLLSIVDKYASGLGPISPDDLTMHVDQLTKLWPTNDWFHGFSFLIQKTEMALLLELYYSKIRKCPVLTGHRSQKQLFHLKLMLLLSNNPRKIDMLGGVEGNGKLTAFKEMAVMFKRQCLERPITIHNGWSKFEELLSNVVLHIVQY